MGDVRMAAGGTNGERRGLSLPIEVFLAGLVAALAMTGCVTAPRAQVVPSPGYLVLVRDGESPYRIVTPRLSSPKEELAARELQHFIREMSGALLPIVSSGAKPTEHEILLGGHDGVDVLVGHGDLVDAA